MFCHKCGSQLVPEAAFCSKCGAPVGTPVAEAVATPPVADDVAATPASESAPASRRSPTVVIGVTLAVIWVVVVGVLMLNPRSSPSTAALAPEAYIPPTTSAPNTETLSNEPTTIAVISAPVPEVSLFAYRDAAIPGINQLTQGLDAMSDLTGRFDYSDPTWQAEVAVALQDIRSGHATLYNIEPVPAALRKTHAALISATSKCNLATYLIADAIDHVDATKMDQATALIIACGKGIKAAPSLWQK